MWVAIIALLILMALPPVIALPDFGRLKPLSDHVPGIKGFATDLCTIEVSKLNSLIIINMKGGARFLHSMSKYRGLELKREGYAPGSAFGFSNLYSKTTYSIWLVLEGRNPVKIYEIRQAEMCLPIVQPLIRFEEKVLEKVGLHKDAFSLCSQAMRVLDQTFREAAAEGNDKKTST